MRIMTETVPAAGDAYMANTLYDVLEVIPTASQETIQAAYRSLITRYHPDKVASLGPDLQAVANARTKEINFAYDILNDAVSRARYDEELQGEDRVALLTKEPASRAKGSTVKVPPRPESVPQPPQSKASRRGRSAMRSRLS